MATALTSSSSSTTVEGYLPQYRGSAATALAPSISSINASSQGLDNINIEEGKSGRETFATSVRTENRPPLIQAHPSRDVASATDLLRRLNRQDKEHHDPGFNANTTGIGPTFGSDW